MPCPPPEAEEMRGWPRRAAPRRVDAGIAGPRRIGRAGLGTRRRCRAARACRRDPQQPAVECRGTGGRRAGREGPADRARVRLGRERGSRRPRAWLRERRRRPSSRRPRRAIPATQGPRDCASGAGVLTLTLTPRECEGRRGRSRSLEARRARDARSHARRGVQGTQGDRPSPGRTVMGRGRHRSYLRSGHATRGAAFSP